MHVVLVINDSAPLCELTRNYIVMAGHEAVCALSGEEGLAAYERQWPAIDRVLVSRDMRGIIDGLEVVRRIRSSGSKVFICLAAAQVDTRTSTEAYAVGASALLQEPYGPHDLHEALELDGE